MRKSLFISVTAIAVLLFAAVPASATHNQPQQFVPFAGSLIGFDSTAPPTGCPAGAVWLFTTTGTGNFTHIGRVAVHAEHCTFLNPDLTGSFGPGPETYTAGNGDTLVLAHWGTFQLTPDFTLSYIQAEWEVIGGTGRFASAVGSGEEEGLGDLVAGTTSITVWGSISYDASDRSGK